MAALSTVIGNRKIYKKRSFLKSRRNFVSSRMIRNYEVVSYMNVEPINKLLDEINNDRSVPRNIRNMVVEAKKSLNDEKSDPNLRINGAISILDEVSNDANIPTYTRTQIWNIVSLLEVMNESLKKKEKL